MSAEWERARRPEQKQQRRQAIIDAAVALFDAEGIDGTSLTAVARAVGLSKANLYRYFDSREAILMQVLSDEQAQWGAEIARSLAPLAKSGDRDAVADVIAESLSGRPRLHALMAVMSTVLERNVGEAAIVDLKQRALADLVGLVSALHTALPAMTPATLTTFVRHFYIFASGLWPAANPVPEVAAVTSRPQFAAMRVQVAPTLREHARLLLTALADD